MSPRRRLGLALTKMRACWLIAIPLLAAPAASWAGAETACDAAIAGASRRLSVPEHVLGSIALVESGRPIGRRVVPWPWSINVGGVGRVYETKTEAVAAVREILAAGTASVDVGCMQINLAAHPQAFDSLETAFDPVSNAEYAARFLRSLSQQTGHLATAMTAYHSQTPHFAADYARRLLAVWPGAAAIGLTANPDRPNTKTPLEALGPSPHKLAVSHFEIVSAHGSAWPANAAPR